MSFHALGKFKCDGCKVLDHDVELPDDMAMSETPLGWLRVVQVRRTPDGEHCAVGHYCPSCARLVESYLRGRHVEHAP